MSILIDLVNVIILPCGFRTIYECTCPRPPQIDTVFLFFVFPFCRENFPVIKPCLVSSHTVKEKRNKRITGRGQNGKSVKESAQEGIRKVKVPLPLLTVKKSSLLGIGMAIFI